MAYRNGRKSNGMVRGEARSKKTNGFPLRLVIGLYATARLREIVFAPVLNCGHIDFYNSTHSEESVLFWRDGWKQTKFRCRSCAGDFDFNSFARCECDYRSSLINQIEHFFEHLDFYIKKMEKAGFSFGYNLFDADCRTQNLASEK